MVTSGRKMCLSQKHADGRAVSHSIAVLTDADDTFTS